MSNVLRQYLPGLQRALHALYSDDPMTAADMDEHRRLLARQMARDEAKRTPSPQLELEAANDG